MVKLRIGIYLTLWIVLCITSTTKAIPSNIHHYMSPDELRSIFHVDSADQVPHYEIVQLNHLSLTPNTNDHSVKRRSINTNNVNEIHHVKKDLSKTEYYKKLKSENRISNSENFSVSDKQLDKNYENNLKKLSDIKEHNVTFSAFGEEYNLTLRRPDGHLIKGGPQSLRMWEVTADPNNKQELKYEEITDQQTSNDTEHIGEVFQDEKNMAAILMRQQLETGDLLMEGSVGSQLVIKPLPGGFIHKHNSMNNNGEINPDHHIAFKRDTDQIDQFSDFAFMEPDRLQKRYRQKRSSSDFSAFVAKEGNTNSTRRSKREIPHMIFPEILVIVDYDGYRLHGGDNVQVKRYFVSFWNGVDLRYRLLKSPRVRICIAGIIISRGRDATPYLERNRVGRDAIDSAAALTDMGKYLFRERRLPVYDIAVAITKLDMCRRNYPTDVCNRGTAGFAYVGGACVVNKRLEKVNSVAIIEDTGGFSGIIVAAHEVGHLLGAVHDGSPPPSYLGGPGAEHCRWEDGYIMSDLRHTERGFRWSPCTVQSFHHFLNGDTATCLHNSPHEDEALGRSLPGTLLSLDAQCRRDRGTSACFKDDRVCSQLFCFDAQSGYCVAYRPAAEGSVCGNGYHCLDGKCVAEHENIIPDYSQQTSNYANPNLYNGAQLSG